MTCAAEIERRKRIRLAVAAYAYEFKSTAIMSDAEFDALAYSIDPQQKTASPYHRDEMKKRVRRLDRFFATSFAPDTGMWIHSHPELDRVAGLYARLYQQEGTLPDA